MRSAEAHEVFRRDADDGEQHPSDAQLLADDVGASVEFGPPVRVTEHDDRCSRWHAVFRRTEEASNSRTGAEQIEVGRADRRDGKLAGLVPFSDGHRHRAEAGNRGERARQPPEVEEATHRRVRIRARLVIPHPLHVQPMHARRVAEIFGRPKQQPVDDPKHRCVRADAETEGEHDTGCESGTRP